MRTMTSAWLLSVSLAIGIASAAPGGKITIGVPLPQAQSQSGRTADLAEGMRQNVMSHLRSATVEVVPLASSDASQIDAEAKEKGCNYVLYTRIEQKHGSGFFGRFAPFVGSKQAAADQQEALMQSTDGSATSNVKKGDSFSVDYRLMATGNATPLKADSVRAKADADGEDMVGPMAEQLAGAVTLAAQNGGQGGSGSTAPGDDSSSSGGKSGFMGGLFGHKHTAPTTANNSASTPDCGKIASMPGTNMTLEQCQQMLAAKVSYDQALADPSASRPGDDSMSCDQIIAELKQQQYTTPDKNKVADMKATAATEQKTLKRQEKEIFEKAAKDQAVMEGALAADTAIAMATGGLAKGVASQAAEKEIDASDKAMGERMAAERKPTEQKMNMYTADTATNASRDLTNNPRIAKLIQMANAKRCKSH